MLIRHDSSQPGKGDTTLYPRPRHPRHRGELCADGRQAGGRACRLGECGKSGRAGEPAGQGTRTLARGCPLGSSWPLSKVVPSIWGRGRRIGSPAGSVYSGERASHWPATPPCWTCRPTSGSPGTATVPEAAPSVFRVLGLRDVLRPLPSPPALLIRAEEGY